MDSPYVCTEPEPAVLSKEGFALVTLVSITIPKLLYEIKEFGRVRCLYVWNLKRSIEDGTCHGVKDTIKNYYSIYYDLTCLTDTEWTKHWRRPPPPLTNKIKSANKN